MIATLRGAVAAGKDHAAVFYPRLHIRVGGLTQVIGAGGAIAGLMARTDANRGVWKAPAGIDAGLNTVTGLEVVLTDAQNGVLNKQGVNCIRVLPNGSMINWGARTMDGDDDTGSEWKYVPIRRFALFLEESLYRGTRWAVFEPSDEPLWAEYPAQHQRLHDVAVPPTSVLQRHDSAGGVLCPLRTRPRPRRTTATRASSTSRSVSRR